MNDFEGIPEEYNNQGGLIGLDGLEGDELLGKIRRIANPIKRQKVINKLTQPSMPSRGSRAEMEKFFHELPVSIKEQLKKAELRLADNIVYSIKPVLSKTVKMFETQDDKMIGLRNISNARLPKNQALLVSGIKVLAGVAGGVTADAQMVTNFSGIEAIPALVSGEINLKCNKKQLLPETSMEIFRTTGYSLTPLGYYKLANPRLITDDVLLELTIELGSMTGIAANTCIYVGLHGTITTP